MSDFGNDPFVNMIFSLFGYFWERFFGTYCQNIDRKGPLNASLVSMQFSIECTVHINAVKNIIAYGKSERQLQQWTYFLTKQKKYLQINMSFRFFIERRFIPKKKKLQDISIKILIMNRGKIMIEKL